MEKIVNKFKNENVFYLVASNPKIYFKKLFLRTLSIGFFTFLLSWIYVNTGLHEIKIPTSMHSLIGIVIGLLLVFRTNTAYDRWWEGRKSISSISTATSFFFIKLRSSTCEENKDGEPFKKSFKIIKENMTGFLNSLKEYLQNINPDGNSIHVSDSFHRKQTVYMEKIMHELHLLEDRNVLSSRNVNMLEKSIEDLLSGSSTCERIKNTPIPVAYALHIKISILIYLLTLPFGLFYDLGLFATPMVMLIFYMIAGIEIISNEIENPFAGDPNDLPVEELINSIINSVE